MHRTVLCCTALYCRVVKCNVSMAIFKKVLCALCKMHFNALQFKVH